MKVTKYSGELVHYDEQKTNQFLRKSGADHMAETIVKEIEVKCMKEFLEKIYNEHINY